MLSLLILVIVLVVCISIVRLLLPMLGLPEPINTVVLLVLGLIALIYLLNTLGARQGSRMSQCGKTLTLMRKCMQIAA